MIWDCFIFFREFDILGIRLHELAEVVDRFVLVEATSTFSGRPKPLYFAENRERVGQFADRIVHVAVDDLEALPGPWEREHHQRNSILRGLVECGPDDVVLISDVDEIPPAEKVAQHAGYEGVTVFFPRLYYYFLNCQANVTYGGTCMLPNRLLTQHSLAPQQVRLGHIGELPYQAERDCGWHFSYCGSAKSIREKIAAYSHQEYNLPQYTDLRHILECMAAGRDLFNRPDVEFRFVPLDDSYPRWVLERRDRFEDLLHGA
jgi:beta-1,4-mannosyl-glycoprotein beta-1,4-N-acetylglucosaminyltransferase